MMANANCTYTELEHTADIGVRVHASAPNVLYACAADAMFSLLHTQPDVTQQPVVYAISVSAIDAESLMVDWLSEMLYIHETTCTIITECSVTEWSPTHLVAVVTANLPVTPPSLEIKAVTYHQLVIQETTDGWIAEVFFDI